MISLLCRADEKSHEPQFRHTLEEYSKPKASLVRVQTTVAYNPSVRSDFIHATQVDPNDSAEGSTSPTLAFLQICATPTLVIALALDGPPWS